MVRRLDDVRVRRRYPEGAALGEQQAAEGARVLPEGLGHEEPQGRSDGQQCGHPRGLRGRVPLRAPVGERHPEDGVQLRGPARLLGDAAEALRRRHRLPDDSLPAGLRPGQGALGRAQGPLRGDLGGQWARRGHDRDAAGARCWPGARLPTGLLEADCRGRRGRALVGRARRGWRRPARVPRRP